MPFFLPIIPLFLSGPSLLFLAAVIPPIVLMVIIYREDKIEKEPPAMILKLFLLGCLAVIPAGLIESLLETFVTKPFLGGLSKTAYGLIFYFLVVGWTEEGCKHFALKHYTWNSIEFNYRFDAIVYAVAVTLGFAAAENVMYVMSYGLGNALMRAVTSIPGHCIFGIYMGHYYGAAKLAQNRALYSRAKRYQFLSIFVPLLLHGFYDFCATRGSEIGTVAFLVYLIILDIAAIVNVRKESKADMRI